GRLPGTARSGEADRAHVRLLPPEPGPPWHLVRVFVAAASLQLGAGAAAGAGGLADHDAGHRAADPESSGEGGAGQAAGGGSTRGISPSRKGPHKMEEGGPVRASLLPGSATQRFPSRPRYLAATVGVAKLISTLVSSPARTATVSVRVSVLPSRTTSAFSV